MDAGFGMITVSPNWRILGVARFLVLQIICFAIYSFCNPSFGDNHG
jgi:hypothetical protein